MSTAVYTVHVGGSVDNHTFTPNRIDTLSGFSTHVITFVFGAGKHAVMRSEWGHPCDPWEVYNAGKSGGLNTGIQEVDSENDGEQYSISEQSDLAKSQYRATVSGTPTPTGAAADSPTHHALSTGTIAGIAVGCALAALLLAGLAFFVWRHKRLARKYAAAQAAKAQKEEGKGAPTPMGNGLSMSPQMGTAPMNPGMGQNGFYGGNERGAKQEYRSVYEQGPPGYDYKHGAVEGGNPPGSTGISPGGVPHGPDEIGALRGTSMSPMSGYGFGAENGPVGGVHSRYSEVPGSEVERKNEAVGNVAVEMDAERR